MTPVLEGAGQPSLDRQYIVFNSAYQRHCRVLHRRHKTGLLIAARPVACVWIYLWSTSVPLEALSRRRVAATILSCTWEWEMRGFFSLRVEPYEVLEEIRAAQVSAVFRQMPIALAVNAVNAIITFTVLQQFIELGRPLAWLCVVLLVTTGRWALWLRYRRVRIGITDVAHWSWLAACGSLLAGMCWGLGGGVLFPTLPVLGHIFLTFFIGAICPCAVGITSSLLASLLAFLLF